ncbi:MAG TPA: hypothetical protein VK642_02350, partial [Burkholderiales bacterium]|nr:hypothetical protein [Burkholderiales bacterium]
MFAHGVKPYPWTDAVVSGNQYGYPTKHILKHGHAVLQMRGVFHADLSLATTTYDNHISVNAGFDKRCSFNDSVHGRGAKRAHI